MIGDSELHYGPGGILISINGACPQSVILCANRNLVTQQIIWPLGMCLRSDSDQPEKKI